MRRPTYCNWTHRTFLTFGIARYEALGHGVFLYKQERAGRWKPVAYLGETLGLDGVP